MKLGLLHPGAMGESLGMALRENGHEVFWASEGRSGATAARAVNFTDAHSITQLCETAEIVISICPPEHAVATARRVAGAGFSGLYVDANAIAPATAQEVKSVIGPTYVDGGVIGPPAHHPGTTRLYLSGEGAQQISQLFAEGPLDARVLQGDMFAASKLKMCFAAWTKGSAALLLNVRALAEALGAADDLLTEWNISQPGLAERVDGTAAATAPKAWRFVAEMEEIARTFSDMGLPGEFHAGAAEIYGRLAALKDAMDADTERAMGEILSAGTQRGN